MVVRQEFILRALSPGAVMSALCAEQGISRKTGYKWLARYRRGGVDALGDRSRRPHGPMGVDGEIVFRVLELHAKYPTWGPKKLLALLQRVDVRGLPKVRTVGRILRRAGIAPRRRRASVVHAPVTTAPRVVADAANVVWTADFKGWWLTGDGKRCEPLTVRDAFSRYVLCARIVSGTTVEATRHEFELLFRRFGLPKHIQVDNGQPFASTRARAGLTRLSAWWVSLGIKLVRGRPAHPQDNGAHERMHGDIAMEVQATPAKTRAAQQRALSTWRRVFNEVRPHEALAMRTPSSLYRRSERRSRSAPPPSYPPGWQIRRVSCKGFVSLAGASFFISEALVGLDVGFEPLEASAHRAWFFGVDLGRVEIAECA